MALGMEHLTWSTIQQQEEKRQKKTSTIIYNEGQILTVQISSSEQATCYHI